MDKISKTTLLTTVTGISLLVCGCATQSTNNTSFDTCYNTELNNFKAQYTKKVLKDNELNFFLNGDKNYDSPNSKCLQNQKQEYTAN